MTYLDLVNAINDLFKPPAAVSFQRAMLGLK
jgi:hypothetical protein